MNIKLFLTAVTLVGGFSFSAMACEGKAKQAKNVNGAEELVAKAPAAVALGERCMFDRECLPNERCMGGTCALPHHENFEIASASSVGRTCNSTAECSPGENCKNGVCQFQNGPGQCLSNVDCPIGEQCVNGQCRR